MASGILVFRSIEAALAAGFQVFDRTSDGYLVRKTISGRYHLALVEPKL